MFGEKTPRVSVYLSQPTTPFLSTAAVVLKISPTMTLWYVQLFVLV